MELLKSRYRDVGRDFSRIRVTVFLPIMDQVDDTRGTIGRFPEAGFDDFIVSPFGRAGIESIRRFVRDVIPAFQ